MSRRRRVLLASAVIVMSLLGVLVVGLFTLTRTPWGLEQGRRYVVRLFASGLQGRLYLGALGGSIFTGLTLDSLEIRDRNDSLFIALGRLEVEFDPRDLLDRRILLRRVRLSSLTAQVFEDSVGMLNFRRIFPSGPPGPPTQVASSDLGPLHQGRGRHHRPRPSPPPRGGVPMPPPAPPRGTA